MQVEQPVFGLESTFKRAWELLIANPIMVVPGMVAALATVFVIFFLLAALLGSVAAGSAIGSSSVGFLAAALSIGATIFAIVVLSMAQIVLVTGMAGAAWKTGIGTLADGWAAFARCWPAALIAMLLLTAASLIAVPLAIVTFGLSLLAFLVFFIFVMPSIILGGRSATDAIAESCQMAKERFVPTLVLVLLIVALSLVGFAVGRVAAFATPVFGGLVAAVIQQAAVVYGMLVIVGEYLKLKGGVQV
jgi:hypothetical protein